MTDTGRTIFGVPGGSGVDLGTGPNVPWWTAEFPGAPDDGTPISPLNNTSSAWTLDSDNEPETDGYGTVITLRTIGEAGSTPFEFAATGIFDITARFVFDLSPTSSADHNVQATINTLHGQISPQFRHRNRNATYIQVVGTCHLVLPALVGDQFGITVNTSNPGDADPDNYCQVFVNIVQIG